MTANRLHLLGWLFIVGWLSAAAGSANAQPIAPAPDGTNTVVTPNGNRYDISGGSFGGDRANLFHSFTQFGLSEGQTANFLTNPNIQNILGRITGGNPSLINGLIQVTGGNSNLFLMNPAGMIFGPNASLNVPGSFNATTATGIGFGNNQWFSAIGNNNWATLIGMPNSFAFTTLPGGSIVNAGNLTVTPGQNLSLIGGTVVNTGQLTAPSGNILISAVPGNNLVRISQAGNLLSLDIQPTTTQSSMPNNWTQPVLSLPELLTGKGAAQATSLTVNPNGEVVLTGNVAVPVVPGTAIASGNINVSGNTGGNVSILGDRVGVIAGKIDASGVNGGGNVLIGGDYQGLGTVPNALRTFVSSDSTINADAISNGNGGRVIVWADETTRFNGNITARGGLFSGNGGFVEVSGKQFLDFRGNVNTLAANGNPGLLLLDPTNITIQNGAGTFNALTQVDQFADPDSGGNTIDAALINNAATNVILQATNDITFSAPVSITTAGVGLTALANNNINVYANITTQGGNVTLNADADNLNGGSLSIGNAAINTNGGNFTGIGRGNVAGGVGIFINSGTINVGAGNIDLTGTGGNGTKSNIGILVVRYSTVKSLNGNISLTGTGSSGSGIDNSGIAIQLGSLVESTGSGTITLSGNAGTGTDNNSGILVDNSQVRSLNGNISLTGTGAGTGTNNYGIGIQNGSLVESTGSGTITFSGTAGAGTNNNSGISITGLGYNVQSAIGNITMTGTGAGTGTTNYGISLDSNAAVEATAANVDLTGTGANGADAIYLNNSSINLIPGIGKDVTLTGNEITLLGTSQVNGNGTIVLQPLTPSLNISVGGIANNPNVLNLSTAELTPPVLNGFAKMVIGRANGTGTLAVDPLGVTFNYPITLEAPNSGGAIVVDGPITAKGSATVTLNGATQLNKNITTQDQSISFVGNVLLGNDVTLSTKNISGGNITFGGTVDGNKQLNITTGTVNFNGSVGGTNPLTALAVDANTNITSTGAISITTTGDITTGDITNPGRAIALTSNNGNIIHPLPGAIDTSSTTGNGGPITLSANNITPGDLNSSSTAGNGGNITLTGKTGNILADVGVVWNSSSSSGAAGDIAIATPNQVGINIIDAKGLPGTGNISISGNDIGFSGGPNSVQGKGNLSIVPFSPNVGIRFQTGLGDDPQAIDLGAPFLSALSDGFSAIVFGGNTTTGNITVDNLPVSFKDPVTFNTQGTIFVNPNQSISGTDNASITLNATTNNLNGNITTQSQNITINGNTLVGNSVLVSNGNSASGNILFNNNIDGSGNLTLETGTVNFSVKGAIGNTTPLGKITVNSAGTATFNAVTATSFTTNAGGTTELKGDVTTTGAQTYGDAVTIANNPILAGSEITFNNTVDGSSDLTANAVSGNLTFNGAVGAASAIGKLTVNSTGITAFNQTVNAASLTTDVGGTTQVKGNVTTTGSQTYGDAVTVANNPILSGDSITFNNTVDGTSDLTVNAGTGNITFKSAIGETTPLTSLTANSKISLGANVTTTGSQTYADAVTVAPNSVFSGNSITLNKTVDVAGNLGIVADNVNLKGTVTTTNDGTLTITNKVILNIENNLNLDGKFIQNGGGTVAINGNIATTNDNISFSDPVTLKAPVNFTLGDATIAFGSSLSAGSNPLNLTAGEIDFSGNVSGTGALTLQPATAGQNIAVGGTDNNTSALDVTASELNLIQNGFSSIAIGRSDSSANVSIPSNLTFLDPVNIQTGTGSIALDGTLTGNDNSSIALNASTINLNYGINTNKNPIALNGTIQLGNDINLSTGGGDIKIVGAIDGNHLLNLDAATGNVLVQGNIGGTAPLSVLNVTATQAEFTNGNIASNSGFNIAAASTKLGGSVTTNNGNININGVLGLTKDARLSTAGGNIAFGGAIDSIDAARNLTLGSGSGSITFNGAVGASSKLGNLAIENAGNVTGNSTINAQQLTALNTEKVNLSGDVTATKVDITAKGDISVKNITTNAGEILFTSGNNFTAGNLNTSGNSGGNITVKAIT